MLCEELAGVDLESQVQISESTLARLQIMVSTDPSRTVDADVERIEQRITEALRTWADQLREELHQQLPAAEADSLAGRFLNAFPVAYQYDVRARDAISDLRELAA